MTAHKTHAMAFCDVLMEIENHPTKQEAITALMTEHNKSVSMLQQHDQEGLDQALEFFWELIEMHKGNPPR